MICVSEADIRAKARKMPLAYLADCQGNSTPNDKGQWCFTKEAYNAIRERYRGYAVSEADPYRSRISGCCDRADQY